MKLELKRGEAGELCLFADGEQLPAQEKVEVHQSPGKLATAVVSFAATEKFTESVKIRQMDEVSE